MLTISSLFIVSVFVAKITAALTVEAIQSNVQTVSDLDGRRIGTIEGDTAEAFLDSRGLSRIAFNDLASLLVAFESKDVEAIVFDGPILAYYANNRGLGKSRLMDKVFSPENYGSPCPPTAHYAKRSTKVCCDCAKMVSMTPWSLIGLVPVIARERGIKRF